MTGPVVPAGGEKGWCLNCNEWGDPDPGRAHPASECPWRPVPPGGEELSSELGRVLAEHQTILYGVDNRARCTCGWVGDDSSWAPTLHRRDALLPTVLAFAEEQGRRRAAEELRAAGEQLELHGALDASVPELLRARAAALAPENARPE